MNRVRFEPCYFFVVKYRLSVAARVAEVTESVVPRPPQPPLVAGRVVALVQFLLVTFGRLRSRSQGFRLEEGLLNRC